MAYVAGTGCSSLPSTHYQKFTFPENAYIGDVKRPYTALGQVRAREDYATLDQAHDEDELCKNYFNKGAHDLLKYAYAKSADAVIGVKSVVFNADGTSETYATPQCADDGQAGQVLLQGVAVTWGKSPAPTVSPSPSPAPSASAAPPAALDEPSSVRFRELRLKQGEDGMDGGIYIMHRDSAGDRDVLLYTMNRKILNRIPVPPGSSDAWLTREDLRSAAARTVFLDTEDTDGDVASRPLAIDQETLSLLPAEDPVTRKPEPIVLVRGKTADWRLTDAPPRDILSVSAASGASGQGSVTYVRYHLDPSGGAGGKWSKFSVTAPGDWDSSKPFPPAGSFPGADYSVK